MKSGYLYVLVHPSDPDLYKIGVTILHPEKRLAQHNRHYEEYAGQIVKETGQNGNSRHTLPSLIRIGPKGLFGEQRLSQIYRIEEELKLKKWNGNWYRGVWTQQRKRGHGHHRCREQRQRETANGC